MENHARPDEMDAQVDDQQVLNPPPTIVDQFAWALTDFDRCDAEEDALIDARVALRRWNARHQTSFQSIPSPKQKEIRDFEPGLTWFSILNLDQDAVDELTQ